jgi:hypothetical protein
VERVCEEFTISNTAWLAPIEPHLPQAEYRAGRCIPFRTRQEHDVLAVWQENRVLIIPTYRGHAERPDVGSCKCHHVHIIASEKRCKSLCGRRQ